MQELENDDYRAHLIIGITGHRDIPSEDEEQLKGRIREIFQNLKKDLPDTPLLLLTPLAEGADRIAAKVAIEEHIRFIVPIPLPENEYCKDFPDSINEFNDLKAKAIGSFELPFSKDEFSKFNHPGPERDKRYEKVGVFVAKHSQVLIALWDGNEPVYTGGTAQIVKYKLEGIPREYAPSISIIDNPDSGLVYHINTRRIKDFDSREYKAELKIKYPLGTSKDMYLGKDGILTKIDRFNHDALNLNKVKVENSRKHLATNATIDKEKFVSNLYARADILAIDYKKKWNLGQISLLITITSLLGVFLAYLNFNILGLLILYFLAYLILAFYFWHLNLLHHSHNRFIEYRSLAEGLRIEFFLRLAGKCEDVADYYLMKHKFFLNWVREVLKSANVLDPQSNPLLCEIKQKWIESEYNYFKHTSKKSSITLKKLKKFTNIIFYSGMFFIVMTIILSFLKYHSILIILTDLIIILPFIAGMIETYIQRSTMSETIDEYIRMEKIFGKAKKLWNDFDMVSNIELITELAKESLRENADWLLLHAKIPEEMPL
jgi:hypothetical protein